MAKQSSTLAQDIGSWLKSLYLELKDYLFTLLLYGALIGILVWVGIRAFEWLYQLFREALGI